MIKTAIKLIDEKIKNLELALKCPLDNDFSRGYDMAIKYQIEFLIKLKQELKND